MELWLDTIDINPIKDAFETGVLSGVTSNPSILSQADCLPEEKLQQILAVQDGEVAVQVVAQDFSGMLEQAKRISALDSRLIIKIPVNSVGLKVIAALAEEEIPTMATAIFDPLQVYLAELAGAIYAAPYIGKIHEATGDYEPVLSEMIEMIDKYDFSIQLLAASIHSKEQVLTCALLGVDAITIPEFVYQDLMKTHALTDASLKKFDDAWRGGRYTSESKLFA